ncbi:MAG: hypothetical protein R6V20_10120 [Desulfobia sp.]
MTDQEKSRLILLFFLILVFILIVRENLVKRPEKVYQTASGRIEMCLACHQDTVLDKAHAGKVIGCSPCHLGDRLAVSKEKAHKGMVINSGDLRIVEKTCGVEGCHSPDVKKVRNSLMATNRGILATLLYYWEEAPHQDGNFTVRDIMKSGENSLALDYFRKLCATCHLWKKRGDLSGFFATKGGGCTACHNQDNPDLPPEKAQKSHPFITKKIPVENCVRCHNRSGRIGISYKGEYESENYGTPYRQGEMSPKTLPGGRYYLSLPADIHYQKGMACIDCHTRDEIMGDGKQYAHYEDQLEIRCRSCHSGEEAEDRRLTTEFSGRWSVASGEWQDKVQWQVDRRKKSGGEQVVFGRTARGNSLDHLDTDSEGRFLTGKLDDKRHPLNPPKKGICDDPLHGRVSCEACHAPWVPQCYGCHIKRDMTEIHLDKLAMEETAGWWEEGRSFLRYEEPMLAVWDQEIVIVTPGCQDIVTLVDEKGEAEDAFNRLTMAALNPHTIRTKGRDCAGCHLSPKTLGLGEGRLWKKNGEWFFESSHQGLKTHAGDTPPLDGFVTITGEVLQHSSREDLRPFNRKELAGLLRAGQCIICHKDYQDRAWQDYTRETECPLFN